MYIEKGFKYSYTKRNCHGKQKCEHALRCMMFGMPKNVQYVDFLACFTERHGIANTVIVLR